MKDIGKVLISLGLFLSVLGIVFVIGDKFGFGKMPGDIFIKRENFTFFFPIVSSIIVSLILTLLFNIFK